MSSLMKRFRFRRSNSGADGSADKPKKKTGKDAWAGARGKSYHVLIPLLRRTQMEVTTPLLGNAHDETPLEAAAVMVGSLALLFVIT